MAFSYDAASRRYRNEATGRYLSPSQVRGYGERFMDLQRLAVRGLAEGLQAGTLTVSEWESHMTAQVRAAHLDQALLGRGGREMMTLSDWGRVGAAIGQQNAYLRGFVAEVAKGNLSGPQIGARALLYIGASRASYERGHAAAHGAELPAHPGDGSTPCGANCRCEWRFEETPGGLTATWVLGGVETEHCEECPQRAGEWVNLPVGAGTPAEVGA